MTGDESSSSKRRILADDADESCSCELTMRAADMRTELKLPGAPQSSVELGFQHPFSILNSQWNWD